MVLEQYVMIHMLEMEKFKFNILDLVKEMEAIFNQPDNQEYENEIEVCCESHIATEEVIEKATKNASQILERFSSGGGIDFLGIIGINGSKEEIKDKFHEAFESISKRMMKTIREARRFRSRFYVNKITGKRECGFKKDPAA